MERFTCKNAYVEDGEKILEINILPEKYCNFDCIFCPIGRSVHKTDEIVIFEDVKNCLKNLEKEIQNIQPDIVFINAMGEALIHNQIIQIIQFVKDKNVKVRLLTNGYLLGIRKYMEIANMCDEILGEIKIVDEALFQKVQRPIEGYHVEEYINHMISFRKQYSGKFIFEVTILKGYNDDEKSLEKIREVIAALLPDKTIIVGMDDVRFAKKLGVSQEVLEYCSDYLLNNFLN